MQLSLVSLAKLFLFHCAVLLTVPFGFVIVEHQYVCLGMDLSSHLWDKLRNKVDFKTDLFFSCFTFFGNFPKGNIITCSPEPFPVWKSLQRLLPWRLHFTWQSPMGRNKSCEKGWKKKKILACVSLNVRKRNMFSKPKLGVCLFR